MDQKKEYRVVNIWGWLEDGKLQELKAGGIAIPLECIFHDWGTAITVDNKAMTVGICEQVNTGKVYQAFPECMNFLNNKGKVTK